VGVIDTEDEAVCTWCGAEVPTDDGFRLAERPSGGTAVFCRLEHVIPWLIKGARWDEPGAGAAGTGADAVEQCSWCDAALGAERVLLVRHRGEHRIGDGFCDLDHLGAWAKAGGRFR
jgi:hypothetical protein